MDIKLDLDPLAELLSYSKVNVNVKRTKPTVSKYFDLTGTKIKRS